MPVGSMAQVQQLVDMGFPRADAVRALEQANASLEQAVALLCAGTVAGEPEPTPPVRAAALLPVEEELPATSQDPDDGERHNVHTTAAQDPPPGSAPLRDADDPDLSAALVLSSVPEALASPRKDGLPCGLLNVGNTCYVNSLLQTLLHIGEFREDMLSYRTPLEARGADEARHAQAEPEEEQGGCGEAPGAGQRRAHCLRLASELRRLFAYTLFTARSCMDPSRLLSELVDQRGQKLPIGSQEDVGEFMHKFMEQLDEGVRAGQLVSAIGPQEAVQLAPSAADATSVVAKVFAEDVGSGGAANETGDTAGCSEAALGGEGIAAPDAGGPEGEADEKGKGHVETARAEEKSTSPEQRKMPSLLQTLFFGEQTQILTYSQEVAPAREDLMDDGEGLLQNDGKAVEKSQLTASEEKSEFLQIFLEVDRGDFYKAWEAANRTEVDYTTPGGEATTASKSIWIERLPRVLFFQLQRVGFDQENKAQVKLDDPFHFPSTVYPDRFLRSNQAAATKAATHVRKLRQRRAELADALRNFEEYQPGISAEQVLGWAADCLEGNGAAGKSESSKPCAEEAGAATEPAHPHRLAAVGAAGAAELTNQLEASGPSCVRLLRAVRDACAAQSLVLRKSMEALDEEIRNAYHGLEQCPFELYAIWVHQGIAGSGHYFAYLRDWPKERWLRFDDNLVSAAVWEDVRDAAVGQEGSNSSAYFLVYVDQGIAEGQRVIGDQAEALEETRTALPQDLARDLSRDNDALEVELRLVAKRKAEQELRCHAEAICQHYGSLLNQWEPMKRQGDSRGSPHDADSRKLLQDPALINYELFLYRLHGEQDVWTYLVAQSVEEQRKAKQWGIEDEGRILYFLRGILISQKCWVGMLRESGLDKCELVPLETVKLSDQFNLVLLQAHLVDKALQHVKDNRGHLIETIGMLALVWSRWDLEERAQHEDAFRHNEVLLLMSSLMYNTVGALEKVRRALTHSKLPAEGVPFDSFRNIFEYFLLLLSGVEWPRHYKDDLANRIQTLFPKISPSKSSRSSASTQAPPKETPPESSKRRLKEAILNHPLTQDQDVLADLEHQKPEPGHEFFDRHRSLYQWAMQNDEAIARDFVLIKCPGLPAEALSTGRLAAE